jgi:hypothetical protein
MVLQDEFARIFTAVPAVIEAARLTRAYTS